jgi:hypothetical protein
MPCSVDIQYKKKCYVPGELVSGEVLLSVDAILSVESILLFLDKSTAIRVEGEGDEEVEECASKALGKFTIHDNVTKKRFVGGRYKFPFAFRMMRGEEATVKYKGRHGGKAVEINNTYMSRCEVRIYGIYKPVAKTEREVNVVEDGKRAGDARVTITENYGTLGCFCLKGDEIDVKMDMQEVFYAGRSHGISVTGYKNKKEVGVSDVKMSLEMAVKSEFSSFPAAMVSRGLRGNEPSIFLGETLPSTTTRNGFFQIQYYLLVEMQLAGVGRVQLKREVPVRNCHSYGERLSLDSSASQVYPEKYLSLMC